MKKLFTFFICLVLTACGGLSSEQKGGLSSEQKGGLSSEQKKEAKEAVEALQKIQAGEESGLVSLMTITPMIVEAKAQVSQAHAILPDGDLRNNLDIAIEAYIGANGLWADGVMNDKYVCDDDKVKEYRRKFPNNPELTDKSRKCMTSESLTYLFSLASENVNKAATSVR